MQQYTYYIHFSYIHTYIHIHIYINTHHKYIHKIHTYYIHITNIHTNMCTDLYMFDAFQYSELSSPTHKPDDSASSSTSTTSTLVSSSSSSSSSSRRRPVVENLYDVFFNIREDEAEHASTMRILQQDATLRSRGRT